MVCEVSARVHGTKKSSSRSLINEAMLYYGKLSTLFTKCAAAYDDDDDGDKNDVDEAVSYCIITSDLR